MQLKGYDRDMAGAITNIQHYSTHDGPGVRTTVFFKGCPLRCYWCQNPETQSSKLDLMVNKVLCTHCGHCVKYCPAHAIYRDKETGEIKTDRSECVLCGNCIPGCLNAARKMYGTVAKVGKVIDAVLRDEKLYRRSNGGMTISGGEITLQTRFAEELLKAGHEEGLTTAIETSGYCRWENLEPLVRNADYVMYDIKSVDPVKHKKGTGVDNALLLDNARKVAKIHDNPLFRMPMIPKYNDSPEDALTLKKFVAEELGLDGEHIELLKYNTLGEAKYDNLDRHDENIQQTPQTNEYFDSLCALLKD